MSGRGPARIVSTLTKPERHLRRDASLVPVAAVAFLFPGKPTWRVNVVMVDRVEIDFVGSRGFCESAATADAQFQIRKIDPTGKMTIIGAATFKATQLFHVMFSGYATSILDPGDLLQVMAPSVVDVTLAHVSMTIRAVRIL
jgi:hypothetical protein